jgi:hypothetical protein
MGATGSEPELGHRELTTELEIEKLGRHRPKEFGNIWSEMGFCISVLGCMLMAVG